VKGDEIVNKQYESDSKLDYLTCHDSQMPFELETLKPYVAVTETQTGNASLKSRSMRW